MQTERRLARLLLPDRLIGEEDAVDRAAREAVEAVSRVRLGLDALSEVGLVDEEAALLPPRVRAAAHESVERGGGLLEDRQDFEGAVAKSALDARARNEEIRAALLLLRLDLAFCRFFIDVVFAHDERAADGEGGVDGEDARTLFARRLAAVGDAFGVLAEEPAAHVVEVAEIVGGNADVRRRNLAESLGGQRTEAHACGEAVGERLHRLFQPLFRMGAAHGDSHAQPSLRAALDGFVVVLAPCKTRACEVRDTHTVAHDDGGVFEEHVLDVDGALCAACLLAALCRAEEERRLFICEQRAQHARERCAGNEGTLLFIFQNLHVGFLPGLASRQPRADEQRGVERERAFEEDLLRDARHLTVC